MSFASQGLGDPEEIPWMIAEEVLLLLAEVRWFCWPPTSHQVIQGRLTFFFPFPFDPQVWRYMRADTMGEDDIASTLRAVEKARAWPFSST